MVLEIKLTFTLAGKFFSFEPIIVSYLVSKVTGESLIESLFIPCLTSIDATKWEYKLPKEIYSKLKKYKITF
jgi:hypothetical protein